MIGIAKVSQPTLRRFLAALTPETARAIRAALRRGIVDREQLSAALERLDVDAVGRLFEPIADQPLKGALTDVTAAGAQAGAAPLSAALALEMTSENPYVALYAGQQAANLVRFVSDAQRLTIRAVVEQGLRSGERIFDMATSLERTVGLLPRHAVAVERMRQRLLAEGTSVTRANQLADDYASRLLRYRVMNIARTETLTALHQGEQLAWDTAAAEGLFDPATASRQWLIAAGACPPICLPMANQIQPLKQPFITGTGARVFSPPTHPSCRCSVQLLLPEAP